MKRASSRLDQSANPNPHREAAAKQFEQAILTRGFGFSHGMKITPALAKTHLLARAQAWLELVEDGVVSSSCRADLLAIFGSGQGYDSRWFWGVIVSGPDAGRDIEEIVKGGFPLEAPVAFAHGSVLAVAAVCGGPESAQALLALGADPASLDAQGATPLERSLERAGENRQAIATIAALVQGGAPTSPTALARAWAIAGLDAPQPRPLGFRLLAALGRDWSDIVAWRGEERLDEICSQTADRLEEARQACAIASMDEFLGSLEQSLARFGLPSAIAFILHARREHRELEAQTPSSNPSAAPRRM